MLTPPKLGDVLGGRYVLRECIGKGGMGTVFLADQPALARTVAVKVLHPLFAQNRQLAAMFRAEAVAASRVRHPNSVAVIDCSQVEGVPYIVMEHVRGRPLGRIIAEESIPVPRAIEIVIQVLRALDAAHACGVVHADVKSDNLLVEQVEDSEHVTLIDYGLACVDGEARELRGEAGERVVSGTPEYMAPEAIRGERVTAATDLYAVGVILHELLTGTTPFSGATSTESMTHHLHDLVIPPSLRRPDRDISTALDDIVLRALRKEPSARFADAGEFATALRGLAPMRAPARARSEECADLAGHDSPTRNCAPLPPRRVARGSSTGARGHLELRRKIGDALIEGQLERIADGYVRLAEALVGEHAYGAAMRELQEGIDVLSGLAGAAAATDVEHLVRALAGLYDDRKSTWVGLAAPRRPARDHHGACTP